MNGKFAFAMGAAAAALAWLQPNAAFASEPLVLAPSSKWILDYADGHCRLAREFEASEGRKNVFYLEQYEPDSRFTVLAAGPDFAPEGIRDVAIRFGPGGAVAIDEQLRFASVDGYGTGVSMGGMGLLADASPIIAPRIPAGSTRYNPPAKPSTLTPAEAAAITHFEMLDGEGVVARLELGAMDEPVRAMNACTDELLTHWGIDIEEHRTRLRAPQPKTNPGTWISYKDYPKELMRSGSQGVVHFRLDVDEKGKATACEIQQSTRPEGFAQVVCREMMRKAAFEPALNAAGKPMRSYWRSSVSFMLPG